MAILPKDIPLSLYIHIPWCVRKCPYCDFNSHEQRAELPEAQYVSALLSDLERDAELASGRTIQSVFFGGGTPSLFSGKAIGSILEGVNRLLTFADDIEITLEANPGTAEQRRFADYAQAGVNRVSLGVQSFSDAALKQLGRIHGADEARAAVAMLIDAGIENVNIDLMHGLPDQTTELALADINTAIALGARHISWYQLTVEPNTEFYKRPPLLPVEDTLADIQERGANGLIASGFAQYEVSAWAVSKADQARHNVNYWQFGDYLAIGAGAHGKVTTQAGIQRYWKTRKPEDYLNAVNPTAGSRMIAEGEIDLEFMMNALRLNNGFSLKLYEQRTGKSSDDILDQLHALESEGFLEHRDQSWRPTDLGQRYLDTVLQAF